MRISTQGMKSSMPSELTSGAQAVLLLLRMCNKVSVYGISSYKPVTPNGKGYQVRNADADLIQACGSELIKCLCS